MFILSLETSNFGFLCWLTVGITILAIAISIYVLTKPGNKNTKMKASVLLILALLGIGLQILILTDNIELTSHNPLFNLIFMIIGSISILGLVILLIFTSSKNLKE